MNGWTSLTIFSLFKWTYMGTKDIFYIINGTAFNHTGCTRTKFLSGLE